MKKSSLIVAMLLCAPLAAGAEGPDQSPALEIIAPSGAKSLMVGLYHYDIDRLSQIAVNQVREYDRLVVESGPMPQVSNQGVSSSNAESEIVALTSSERSEILSHFGCLYWDEKPIPHPIRKLPTSLMVIQLQVESARMSRRRPLSISGSNPPLARPARLRASI